MVCDKKVDMKFPKGWALNAKIVGDKETEMKRLEKLRQDEEEERIRREELELSKIKDEEEGKANETVINIV